MRIPASSRPGPAISMPVNALKYKRRPPAPASAVERRGTELETFDQPDRCAMHALVLVPCVPIRSPEGPTPAALLSPPGLSTTTHPPTSTQQRQRSARGAGSPDSPPDAALLTRWLRRSLISPRHRAPQHASRGQRSAFSCARGARPPDSA